MTLEETFIVIEGLYKALYGSWRGDFRISRTDSIWRVQMTDPDSDLDPVGDGASLLEATTAILGELEGRVKANLASLQAALKPRPS